MRDVFLVAAVPMLTWPPLGRHASGALFHKKGCRIKRSRWFQWSHEAAELATWYSVILRVLLVHCMKHGWYNDIHCVPMMIKKYDGPGHENASDSDESAVVVAADEPLPDNERPRVADTEEEKLSQQRKTKTGIHLCTNILANRSTRGQLLAVFHLSSPAREAHDLHVTQVKTQIGASDWHEDMACGLWQHDLTLILDVFVDMAKLLHIGFSPPKPFLDGRQPYTTCSCQ